MTVGSFCVKQLLASSLNGRRRAPGPLESSGGSAVVLRQRADVCACDATGRISVRLDSSTAAAAGNRVGLE